MSGRFPCHLNAITSGNGSIRCHLSSGEMLKKVAEDLKARFRPPKQCHGLKHAQLTPQSQQPDWEHTYEPVPCGGPKELLQSFSLKIKNLVNEKKKKLQKNNKPSVPRSVLSLRKMQLSASVEGQGKGSTSPSSLSRHGSRPYLATPATNPPSPLGHRLQPPACPSYELYAGTFKDFRLNSFFSL